MLFDFSDMPSFAEGKMELQCRAHLWDGTVGAWVSIFVLSYPFLPLLHLFFCCALWFNIVLLPNFPLLLIVNSWQGLLGELILLQQQIQEHEEEARRAAGQYSTSYAQQKRKVMDGSGGYWCITLISHFCWHHAALIGWGAPALGNYF